MQAPGVEPTTFVLLDAAGPPRWGWDSLCEHVFPVLPHKIPGQAVSQAVGGHACDDGTGILLTDES